VPCPYTVEGPYSDRYHVAKQWARAAVWLAVCAGAGVLLACGVCRA
jgi:hypothetical protein